MSQNQKSTLRLVDWEQVRMLTISGHTIHLVMNDGTREFEFESEEAACSFCNALSQQCGRAQANGLGGTSPTDASDYAVTEGRLPPSKNEAALLTN